MATGPAEAKEAMTMARRAKVKGAMREQGEVLKLSTTRSFEGIGAPGSGRNCNPRGRQTCVQFYSGRGRYTRQRALVTAQHDTREQKSSRQRAETDGEDGDSHNQ